MSSGRITNSRENPRNLSFANTPSKAMSNDLSQKPAPPTPILDRFRSLLKPRDDELRVTIDDDVLPPTTEEVVRLYELVLSELTFNSKPIITDLTIIAGEQREHGAGIAEAICARILEVPVEQKLPSLYLLDSIVKNIGRDYIRYFSFRLPEVFCEAYRQVLPNMYSAMRHLFGTWSTVFPPSVLRKIESQLQFSPQLNTQPSGLRASESPRPTHGIHVNPKYVRQMEHPAMDSEVQQSKGVSSNLKLYGEKRGTGYDEYDSDHPEVMLSRVGAHGADPSNSLGSAPYAVGPKKSHPFPSGKLTRPSSPSKIRTDRLSSSGVEEFTVDNSPGSFVETALLSPITDFASSRAIERDDEVSEWRQYPDGKRGRFESSKAHDMFERQRTRALIYAYGSDRGQRTPNESLQVERSDTIGIGNKLTPLSWQNTEEEEFDWDKMGSTLPVRSNNKEFPAPSVPPSRVGPRSSLGIRSGASSVSNVRSYGSSHSRLPVRDDPSIIAEDAISSLDAGHGSMSKISGFQNEGNQILGLRCNGEVPKWSHSLYDSFQLHPMTKGGRDFRMPLSTNGTSLTSGSRMGSNIESSAAADAAQLPTIPSSVGIWPSVNVNRSYPPPMNPIPSLHRQNKRDILSTNHGQQKSLYVAGQHQLDTFGAKDAHPMRTPQLPNQQATLNQPDQASVTSLQHIMPPQVAQDRRFPPATAPLPSHLLTQPSNHLYGLQRSTAAVSAALPTLTPVSQLPLQVQNIPGSSVLVQGGILPPLPPGQPLPSSHTLPLSQTSTGSSQAPGTVFTGLISSLMAQGLISLEKQTSVQDSVGLEFNVELLKVRHESAINALYNDLPRQCTTCGLRFKCQEEHRSHMDWHVTKNRMSKNRKQKPARKWFVSANMWLSGAEALGADAVPGFLPVETVVEKKDDEELAVPADDEQKTCALCGEPFEDFYSDETEEWMYKGAVYMNAPTGLMVELDRSQLGPIVHAKCRPESSTAPPES